MKSGVDRSTGRQAETQGLGAHYLRAGDRLPDVTMGTTGTDEDQFSATRVTLQ